MIFEIKRDKILEEGYEITHLLNRIRQTKGIDILPAMRLRYANSLKNNITAMRITHIDDVSFRVVIERYVDNNYVYDDYCLASSPEDWDGRCPIEQEMNDSLLFMCVSSMFEFCTYQLESVKHIDIFEDFYFVVYAQQKKQQDVIESLEYDVKKLETDLSYYRTLAQDLAKYHAQDILAHVIQLSVASLEADTSNGIYGDETVNLWEEICIYQQKSCFYNESKLDNDVENACYQALQKLSKEHYMMLLMSITDFEDDYYVNGDGCPEHWHEQATSLGDGIDKLLTKIIPKVLGCALDNTSERVQSWLR